MLHVAGGDDYFLFSILPPAFFKMDVPVLLFVLSAPVKSQSKLMEMAFHKVPFEEGASTR